MASAPSQNDATRPLAAPSHPDNRALRSGDARPPDVSHVAVMSKVNGEGGVVRRAASLTGRAVLALLALILVLIGSRYETLPSIPSPAPVFAHELRVGGASFGGGLPEDYQVTYSDDVEIGLRLGKRQEDRDQVVHLFGRNLSDGSVGILSTGGNVPIMDGNGDGIATLWGLRDLEEHPSGGHLAFAMPPSREWTWLDVAHLEVRGAPFLRVCTEVTTALKRTAGGGHFAGVPGYATANVGGPPTTVTCTKAVPLF